MSKVIKPDNIIYIGASLYMDTVQNRYLERQYPYILKAQIIERYPILTKDIVKNLVELIKKLKKLKKLFF